MPHVEWLVVGHALRLAGVAVVVGTGVAFIATRALGALLYHVAPVDPITFAVVPVIPVIMAALATWVPARQAGRADPAVVLREE